MVVVALFLTKDGLLLFAAGKRRRILHHQGRKPLFKLFLFVFVHRFHCGEEFVASIQGPDAWACRPSSLHHGCDEECGS